VIGATRLEGRDAIALLTLHYTLAHSNGPRGADAIGQPLAIVYNAASSSSVTDSIDGLWNTFTCTALSKTGDNLVIGEVPRSGYEFEYTRLLPPDRMSQTR